MGPLVRLRFDIVDLMRAGEAPAPFQHRLSRPIPRCCDQLSRPFVAAMETGRVPFPLPMCSFAVKRSPENFGPAYRANVILQPGAIALGLHAPIARVANSPWVLARSRPEREPMGSITSPWPALSIPVLVQAASAAALQHPYLGFSG